MAKRKRRTPQEIKADKIIKKQLMILGQHIYDESRQDVRVHTEDLIKSINFTVKPDTTLKLTQLAYGKYVTPKYSNSDNTKARTNIVKIKVEENITDGTEIIIKEITESILYPFKK